MPDSPAGLAGVRRREEVYAPWNRVQEITSVSLQGSNNILPYGDHINDGIVQVSFTLPVANGLWQMKPSQARPMRLILFQEPQVVESVALWE